MIHDFVPVCVLSCKSKPEAFVFIKYSVGLSTKKWAPLFLLYDDHLVSSVYYMLFFITKMFSDSHDSQHLFDNSKILYLKTVHFVPMLNLFRENKIQLFFVSIRACFLLTSLLECCVKCVPEKMSLKENC